MAMAVHVHDVVVNSQSGDGSATVTETESTIGLSERVTWTPREQCVLVEEYVSRERALAGAFSGPGSGGKARCRAWADLLDAVNSLVNLIRLNL